MPRKKSAKKMVEAETATATAETPPVNDTATETMPAHRPEWIDGAPVNADGEFIREGSPRATTQMSLPVQPENDPAQQAEASTEQKGKNWGDPYKSIFSCPEMGFELGENRRFKQRVFKFADKPTTDILSELKEHGFVYRGGEKAWTIPATPESRKLTDEMARNWAGPNYIRSVER